MKTRVAFLNLVPDSLAKNLAEVFFVIAFTLGAFMFNLKVIESVFPGGSPLALFSGSTSMFKSTQESRKVSQNIVMKRPGKEVEFSSHISVAKLKRFTNTVKRKEKGAIDWTNVRRGDELFSRDAIQTFKRSSASIEFAHESFLDIGANSLVIIKNINNDILTQNKTARLVLSKGRLYSELFGSRNGRNGAMGMEIATDNFTARIASSEQGAPAKFKIHINPDKSSTIEMLDGVAVVQSGDEMVEVQANQALTVTPGQAMPKPVSLLGLMKTISPKNNGIFSYHDVPRKIDFVWKSKSNADSYTVVIARDKKFSDILAQERVEKSFFSHANIKSGKYYWKVRGNTGWVEGVYTAPKVINVIEDVEPPSLEVVMPSATVSGYMHEITGTTDRGTKIFINNNPVSVSKNGTFRKTLNLEDGTNIIVVEAVDSTGNVNYKTKLVNVKGV